MPTFSYTCENGHEFDAYQSSWKEPNPVCECGGISERVIRSSKHIPSSAFPYTTTHLNGKPIEVKSSKHLEQLCKQYGKVHRPDAAWVTERYEGYDVHSGQQVYTQGSGAGVPGSWSSGLPKEYMEAMAVRLGA